MQDSTTLCICIIDEKVERNEANVDVALQYPEAAAVKSGRNGIIPVQMNRGKWTFLFMRYFIRFLMRKSKLLYCNPLCSL